MLKIFYQNHLHKAAYTGVFKRNAKLQKSKGISAFFHVAILPKMIILCYLTTLFLYFRLSGSLVKTPHGNRPSRLVIKTIEPPVEAALICLLRALPALDSLPDLPVNPVVENAPQQAWEEGVKFACVCTCVCWEGVVSATLPVRQAPSAGPLIYAQALLQDGGTSPSQSCLGKCLELATGACCAEAQTLLAGEASDGTRGATALPMQVPPEPVFSILSGFMV